MGRYANAFGRSPRGHLRSARVSRAALRHRRGRAQLRRRGKAGQAGAAPLIPGQSSRGGATSYAAAARRTLQAFAVDLRGQGRSSCTPGRYTLDNMGNDLVRFIDLAIGRPTIVSGLSSGGWALGCRLMPSPARSATHYEDPPPFCRARDLVRPIDPPGDRPAVRAVEQVSRRPVERAAPGRHAGRGAPELRRGSPRSSQR
jgi:hypothetical protein